MTFKEEFGLLNDLNYKDVFPAFESYTLKGEDWLWYIKKDNVCLFTEEYFNTLAIVCALVVAISAPSLQKLFSETRH